MTKFNELNLDESLVMTKLNRLDVSKAGEITKETCSSPTSLVLALMYLDRLRHNNTKYLSSISSTDLFLVSLMVASKFLHDDGEEDEVFNDEWASSGGMDKKELNKLEMDFLTAIDWNIYVSPNDYEGTMDKLELAVAIKEVNRRGGWTTYSDLLVMSKQMDMLKLWGILYEYTVKLTVVCAFAYAASLMTMVGTCHLVNRTMTSMLLQQTQHEHEMRPETAVVRPNTDLANEDQTIDILESVDDRLGFAGYVNATETECNIAKHTNFVQHHSEEEPFQQHAADVMTRLRPALFALKMGSFRDLLLGTQFISAMGHV